MSEEAPEPKFIKELGGWVCPICRESFNTKQKALEHIKAVHHREGEDRVEKEPGEVRERAKEYRGDFEVEFEAKDVRFKLSLSNVTPKEGEELAVKLFRELKGVDE